MRDLLIKICEPSIWIIVLVEALISITLIRDAIVTKKSISFFSFFFTLGLIFDAIIIGIGTVLAREAIYAISPIRFIAHGVLIPLLLPICGYALKLKRKFMIIVWAVTIILMIFGIAEALATDLEVIELAGVVRCASTDDTPDWAKTISTLLSFGTVIPMMIAGIIAWIRQGNQYLFLSGVFMFAFSALGPATGNTDLIFFISMFGELFLILFLFLYIKKDDSTPRDCEYWNTKGWAGKKRPWKSI